jgi:glycosyltransferase involved in cell wall biosynthesis
MDFPRIQIYHDALLQKGGAEQVASLWAAAFNAKLNVLAKSKYYSSDLDFSTNVIFPWIRTQRSLELIYPFLPLTYFFTKKNPSRIRLVSTTGVAHQIPGRWGKRILYIHSPARWIWDKESFDINRKKIEILLANVLRPIFRFYDRKSIRSGDVLLVNSNATREKVARVYSRDSNVVFPPVVPKSLAARKVKLPSNFSKFYLHVGRVRGYKGLDFLIQAFQSSKYKLILVGESTEKFRTDCIIGLGFVNASELRWLYENAQALIAVSREDFGLTPVEASLYGCPTIAFRHLGYLDSVREGVSGKFVIPYDIKDFQLALSNHRKENFSKLPMQEFAREFSLESHINLLKGYL